MQYSKAVIFSKRANLLPYFFSNYINNNHISDAQLMRLKSDYEREREVQLILLVRYEQGKTICRIKCPINPLPVKGEFEVVSVYEVRTFLRHQGWTCVDEYNLNLFR